MRVGKANWWIWVFRHSDSVAFVADARRSKTVVEKVLGDRRPDVWLSDRLGSQIGCAQHAHQFCLAHLIREVQYVVDQADSVFAPGLNKRACVVGRRREELTDSILKTYLADLERRLNRLLGRRPTHTAGQKLQETIKAIRGNLFVFRMKPGDRSHQQWLRACVTSRCRACQSALDAPADRRKT